MPGTLHVVATPIGNLEDISARALRVLRESALIAAEDTRRTGQLLARYGIRTPTTSLHEHNERQKTRTILERLSRGEDVAVVSDAGTPTISDPGRHLVRAAFEAGVKVQPVPGPSAIMTALAASGFPADTFTFLGFPPTRSKDRNGWFEALVNAGRTVCFFESPHRVVATLGDLHAKIGDRQIVIGRELTKAHEELVNGPISDVLKALGNPRGEYTIVVDIGHAANIVAAQVAAEATDAQLAAELGLLTKSETISRRRGIAVLARRHGRSPNDVYEAIERHRKSAK